MFIKVAETLIGDDAGVGYVLRFRRSNITQFYKFW